MKTYMKVTNTAAASLRFDLCPAATSAVVSGFLQDLIQEGILLKEQSYFACDPKKIGRLDKRLWKKPKKILRRESRTILSLVSLWMEERTQH